MKGGLFFLLLVLGNPARAAVTIEWSSDPNATNRQSDGLTPLDADFKFELGTFEGITPDGSNLGKWQEAWRSFGDAVYNPAQARFSNTRSLASNAAPFTTSTRIYIWGRDGLKPGSEWILIGKPTWKWPVANTGGPPPFPERYLVAATSDPDVILGSVNSGGFHMQTAVADFDLNYGQWISFEFNEGEASGADEDFDRDGLSNYLEFALGSDPKARDAPFEVALNSEFEIKIPRKPGRAVKWVLKRSDNLSDFMEMAEGFEITIDEPTRLVFKVTGTFAGRQFFRVDAVTP